jgi:hypothetical protein
MKDITREWIAKAEAVSQRVNELRCAIPLPGEERHGRQSPSGLGGSVPGASPGSHTAGAARLMLVRAGQSQVSPGDARR